MPGSNGFHDGFLDLPARPGKPRTEGLTHVMDKGLGIRDIEQLFDTAGAFVDIVKLGWGTAYITNNLEKKIALYRSFETPVVCGGTLFEAVYGRDRIDEYKTLARRAPHRPRRDLRRDDRHPARAQARADRRLRPRLHRPLRGRLEGRRGRLRARTSGCEWIKEELDAGAWKVVTEGREGGTAGIYRPTGEMRTGLVDEIVHEVSVSDLIFEAPTKASQAWFVKHFGPNVNVGNIPPDEVIPLETLRLGPARRHPEGGAARWRAGPNCLSSTGRRWRRPRSSVRSSMRFPAASRSPAPSRRRSRCCSTCSTRSRPTPASSRSTRTSSSPRPTPSGVPSRSATARRWRSTRARRLRSRPRSTARRSGSASPTSAARSARSSRSAAPSAGSTPGSPGCAATSRRRARTRPRWAGTRTHELWKANPLADWDDQRCWDYIRERDLPYNELHDRGYASIGCTHCTKPGTGRDGRWTGSEKTECGLHAIRPLARTNWPVESGD